VPQGAYEFVAAMDRLVDQLPVDEPTHKGLEKLGLLENGLHLHIGLD
jgi:hypothetical protein